MPSCRRSSPSLGLLRHEHSSFREEGGRAVLPTITLLPQVSHSCRTTAWKLSVCCVIFPHFKFYLKVPGNSWNKSVWKSILFSQSRLGLLFVCITLFLSRKELCCEMAILMVETQALQSIRPQVYFFLSQFSNWGTHGKYMSSLDVISPSAKWE